MITQHLIRSGNLRQIYQLIDQNIGISRARLAKITKLSKTTVSSLVDELIAGGYVLDCGAGASQQQGRRPNVLRVNGAGNVVAVISWRRAGWTLHWWQPIAKCCCAARCLWPNRMTA